MTTLEDDSKYLVYKIGDEFYASPLLSVREVMEYQKPKFIPNMVKHFTGVINVRGSIVGVVDFRIKFNLPQKNSPRTSMLLCDTEEGPVAALVDSVDFVVDLTQNEIDLKPPIRTQIGTNYLIGVAKKGDKLITLIDILKSLTEEHLKFVA
jgi:purine-binding chemotaxis protein CheW